MNKLLVLLFIFVVTLFSCDGRDRKHKTNVDVLKENNLLDAFSEKIKYTPKAYAEVLTDTILSNGYTIKIKTFSDMSHSFLDEFKVNAITHKHYFRKIISEVFIEKDNTIIFNTTIDNTFFKTNSISNTINFEDYILNPIEVDQLQSIDNNKVILVASMRVPKTVNTAVYNIIIDENGYFELLKIDYART